MLDSRAGRVLEPGVRSMIDPREMRWIEEHATGGVDHLLLGTSLPLFLTPALHDLEAWNEAVCDGAWGRAAPRAWGRRSARAPTSSTGRRSGDSFESMCRHIREVGTGRARRAAGHDRRAVGRRAPRLPGRGRLPARHRDALAGLAGGVLAVPQPARPQRAAHDALRRVARGRPCCARLLARAARRRAADGALALRPRRAVVRQPGRRRWCSRAARPASSSRRPSRRRARTAASSSSACSSTRSANPGFSGT